MAIAKVNWMNKYLDTIKKPKTKICTARAAGGTDFGALYLIVPSYLVSLINT